MLVSIIRTAIEKRGIFLMLSFLVIGLGLFSYQKLPIDAVPDITNVQVQINTQAEGYSPLETEQRITFLVENAHIAIITKIKISMTIPLQTKKHSYFSS